MLLPGERYAGVRGEPEVLLSGSMGQLCAGFAGPPASLPAPAGGNAQMLMQLKVPLACRDAGRDRVGLADQLKPG